MFWFLLSINLVVIKSFSSALTINLVVIKSFSSALTTPLMKKILVTGATDGIGLETAKALKALGHTVLVHGRNSEKVQRVAAELGGAESYVADLSRVADLRKMVNQVRGKHTSLDVVINNAGVFNGPLPPSGALDVRFLVNAIAPYFLTTQLLDLLDDDARVINLASAAQMPVDFDALYGRKQLRDPSLTYAQSKLAVIAWTRVLARSVRPSVVAVNPGSLLATKMVKDAFGITGSDVTKGSDILVRAALDDTTFAKASATGRYWDNDGDTFYDPHLSDAAAEKIVAAFDDIIHRAFSSSSRDR